jgi:hypothetical protein
MDYKQQRRRLAVHDEMLLEAIAADGIAAAPSSFQHAVALALAAGASRSWPPSRQ